MLLASWVLCAASRAALHFHFRPQSHRASRPITSMPNKFALGHLPENAREKISRLLLPDNRTLQPSDKTTWPTDSLLRLLVPFLCPQLPPRWAFDFPPDHNDRGSPDGVLVAYLFFFNELDLRVQKESDIYKLESQLEGQRSSSRQFCLSSAIYHQGVAFPIFRWCSSSP